MAGIYLHIPFCKQACHYCDFHFSTSLKNKDAFLSSLKKEIELQSKYLNSEKISTVYFGGGTPSLLNVPELMAIFETLNKHFDIEENAEITLEANPDDLTNEKISDLASTPVNRLSIGIQSFQDQDLKWMNRAHTSDEALRSVKYAQQKGFENISIDLMYGLPTLTEHQWRNNLQIAFALDVKHISAYCLTVESGTALGHDVKAGKTKIADEQESVKQFEIMLKAMNDSEFIQYEISNFCKEGFYSKHNSNYWLKERYLGLGPSAHSFNGATRQWNVSNNSIYIRSLEKNELNFEKEELTKEQQYNEYILTSLRTIWGTSLDQIKENYGNKLAENCLKVSAKYISSNDIELINNKLILTNKGKLFADKIAGDLFILAS